jgi:hypothetical protein
VANKASICREDEPKNGFQFTDNKRVSKNGHRRVLALTNVACLSFSRTSCCQKHHTSFAPAMQDQDSLDTTTPPPTTAPDHPTAMQRQIDPGFKALISTATSSNQTVAEQSQSASGVMAPIPTTDSASPTAMRDPAHTGATTLPPTLTPTHPATADENPPAYFPAVLPPVAEEAAGEHKDDPRDTQSSESNRIPTSGSAESPEVAPFSDSIPEASTISKTPATVLDNDEAAGPLQDFKSTAFRPEYNVYLRSNLGLRAGDIVMEKRRYLVVEDRFDRDIRAYPMTTFSDTNPNRVRDLTVKGDSLGLRYRVSDFVQNVAAHHPGGPVKPEARCFDDGKIMLHWSGPVDAPPPSKVSFVSLIPETIVISKYGVKLMGRCTNKSYNQLRDAAKRHSAKRDFATANTVQQQRIMDPDYQTSAYVCWNLFRK